MGMRQVQNSILLVGSNKASEDETIAQCLKQTTTTKLNLLLP